MEYAFTTSWGVTTRLIGALIMCHGDDDGLRLPPRVAPKHIVIIPFVSKPEFADAILDYSQEIAKVLGSLEYAGEKVVVHIDRRDKRGGEKSWEWIKKGIPLRIEVGPRELEARSCAVSRRDRPHKEKTVMTLDSLKETLLALLQEMQDGYYAEAKAHRDAHTYTHITNFDEMKAFFTPKNKNKPEIHGGFVLAKWCGDAETEKLLDELKVTIRCLPLEQSGTEGKCVITGRPATLDAIFAKSY
jgi:prolyl-tRNA synthetase